MCMAEARVSQLREALLPVSALMVIPPMAQFAHAVEEPPPWLRGEGYIHTCLAAATP